MTYDVFLLFSALQWRNKLCIPYFKLINDAFRPHSLAMSSSMLYLYFQTENVHRYTKEVYFILFWWEKKTLTKWYFKSIFHCLCINHSQILSYNILEIITSREGLDPKFLLDTYKIHKRIQNCAKWNVTMMSYVFQGWHDHCVMCARKNCAFKTISIAKSQVHSVRFILLILRFFGEKKLTRIVQQICSSTYLVI